MINIVAWVLLIFPGILYFAQVISSINFHFAQKIGLQESPLETDKILQRAERYTVYWDLVTLLWMPLSGFLIITENKYWPIFAFLGGAIYFDAAGREAIKILYLKHEGIRMGPPKQAFFFFTTYFVMFVLAILALLVSMQKLLLIL